jgi:hypothetical protein
MVGFLNNGKKCERPGSSDETRYFSRFVQGGKGAKNISGTRVHIFGEYFWEDGILNESGTGKPN